MSYLNKKKNAEEKSIRFLIIVVIISLLLGLFVFILMPPQLKDDFCPKDSSKLYKHRLSILIDLSTPLNSQNQKIVNNMINYWLENNKPMQKISIYFLKSNDIDDFDESITLCSPPKSQILAFAYGRQKAHKTIENFKNKIESVLNDDIKTKTNLNSSKILESVRQITNSSNWISGSSRLVLISDLIEYSKFANFLSIPVPTYDSWINLSANKGLVNSIQIGRGDRFQICQLYTNQPEYKERENALVFWTQLLQKKGVDETQLRCDGIVMDQI